MRLRDAAGELVLPSTISCTRAPAVGEGVMHSSAKVMLNVSVTPDEVTDQSSPDMGVTPLPAIVTKLDSPAGYVNTRAAVLTVVPSENTT